MRSVLGADATFADDDPASRIGWLRLHLGALARIPMPGGGLTVQRLRVLAGLGAADGSLARLAEGHLDALAILDELGAPGTGDRLLGVWAARPELLAARPTEHGWRLIGSKPWCSGAVALDRALLTATDPDGAVRLFDIDVAAVHFADDWQPIGMRASDSRTACVDVEVPGDAQVGPPGAYVGRPGFGHGGVGVAACWHGLAQRIAGDFLDDATHRENPYSRAAAGRALASMAASSALLAAAGRQIDERPGDEAAARRRAATVRVGVELSARAVLDASISPQGESALCFDVDHGRAVTDLTVYLGQLHFGTDAAGVEVHPADDWWSS
jgi:alkylation response protein AidB-like acyl-CoA dehydrogenase